MFNISKFPCQQKYTDVSSYETKEIFTIDTITFRSIQQNLLFLETYLNFRINTSDTNGAVSIKLFIQGKGTPSA